MTREEFLVLDTEGSYILREIAIVNSQGTLIYEALADRRNSQINRLKSKPLEKIIKDLSQILPNQTVVCHNVRHDRKILRNSFQKCHQSLPSIKFICTIQLAQQKYPQLPSYGLEYLSHKLFLKFNHRLFERVKAHTACYDAQFTLKLYQHLISEANNFENKPMTTNSSIPNPFSSNRVDNPFQNHLDFPHIYQNQFEHLKSLVEDIKNDTKLGKQSKAAVVIGEAGNGKTHLMMRLAQATLKTNRLLYVRQPNNAESVMHHIYARILESFAQKIDIAETEKTQLDLLLARVFTRILKIIQQNEKTQKLTGIIEALENNNLIIYEGLGAEGTKKHANNWRYIENKVTRWRETNYSTGGYSPHILKGILKFCRYQDDVTKGINYKDIVRRWLAGIESDDPTIKDIGLNNWREDDLSKEDFALEGIRLFGQLSTLDEPLIIIFDQLEFLISRPAILESFGNALREIITSVPNCLVVINLFPDRWQHFQNYWDSSVTDRLSANQISLKTPSQQELKQILDLKCQEVACNMNDLFTGDDLAVILAQPSIRKTINKASDYYRYRVLNIPLPEEYPWQNPLNIDSRIANLENALRQIVNICSPLIAEKDRVVEEGEQIVDDDIFIFEETADNTSSIKSPPKPTNIIEKYLDVNEKQIQQDYDRPHIITDDDDYGKLVTIIEAFQVYDPAIKKDYLALGKRKLPAHLLIVKNDRQFVIGFLNIGGSPFTSRIKNFNELANSNDKIKFYLLRDKREEEIRGKVGREEIEKLNYLKNGSFMIVTRNDRILFELIYKMIVDINQEDLEVNIAEAIAFFIEKYDDYWLIKNLTAK